MNSLKERPAGVRSWVERSARVRPAVPPALVQLAIAVFAGLSLVKLLGRFSPLLVGGGVIALAFCTAFLARPDLGVLLVLLARSATDLALQGGRQPTSAAASLLSPNTSLILVLILAGGLYILSRRVRWLSLPGGVLLVFMLIAGAIGMVRSEDVLLSFKEWLSLVAVFVVYALAAHFFRTPEEIQRVIDVIALSFVLPAIYGFWQLAGHNGFILSGGLSRIPGTFFHPNPFGFYLVMIIAVFAGQFFVSTGRRQRLAAAIVVAAGILLIGTLTRIAWAGAVIALLTIGVLRNRALLWMVPLAVLLVAAVSPSSVQRGANPFANTEASGIDDRIGMWKATYGFWIDATAVPGSDIATAMNRLGGLGPGGVGFLTKRYRGFEFAAHNDYIRILNEFGAFGLLLYFLLVVVMLRFAYRTMRMALRTPMAAVPMSFFALTLAFTFASITDNVFDATQNQVYYWALAGLTVAIGQTLSAKAPRRDAPSTRIAVRRPVGAAPRTAGA